MNKKKKKKLNKEKKRKQKKTKKKKTQTKTKQKQKKKERKSQCGGHYNSNFIESILTINGEKWASGVKGGYAHFNMYIFHF